MLENKDKIPCSIGILTLNSGEGLRRCLESLSDFGEVIICDGNSTDNTLDIAREFNAKIIKQYDTDDTNIKCVIDKATVRQKNMDASTNDWYFFMDSDDTLSDEVVDEIREIVRAKSPDYLVYKMPTRIYIDGKEIKHEATYPSYQIRLFNKIINPKFKGDVHDRVVFDDTKFKIGELKNFYNFHWSKDRVSNFWSYLKNYGTWETLHVEYESFLSFLIKGIYRRVGIIMKYLVYRLPVMYYKFGFEESMPLSIELTIVRYHIFILMRIIYKYIISNFWYIFVVETLKGKDIYRILTNYPLYKLECVGEILDIGSGSVRASYYRFLRMFKWHKVTTVDIDPNRNPTIVCDITKNNLPVTNNYYDNVLVFNLLEHLSDRTKVVDEVYRVLKPGGRLIGCVPFLVNVHPDPQDFVRMAKDELNQLFSKAGFNVIEIYPIGEGPFTAGYSMIEWVLPKFIKIIVYPFIYFFDFLIRKIWKKQDLVAKYPIAYNFYIKK